MKNSPPSWEQLASLAGKAAATNDTQPAASAAQIAAVAMRNASLKAPGLGATVFGWLALPKVWLPLVVGLLLLGGWAFQSRQSPEARAAARLDGWAGDTLRQLKAWYPLECEDAGEIGLLMQRRVGEMKRTAPDSSAARDLLSLTERELVSRLTPEQRALFAAEQARLRERWFRAP